MTATRSAVPRSRQASARATAPVRRGAPPGARPPDPQRDRRERPSRRRRRGRCSRPDRPPARRPGSPRDASLVRQAVWSARPDRGRRRRRSFGLTAARDRDHGQLALGRGRPRPDDPGDVSARRRAARGPGLRCRGHAPRRADRRPARTRWREGRPGPPHVLGPALGDDPPGPAAVAGRSRATGRTTTRPRPPIGPPWRPHSGRRPDRLVTAIDGCGVSTYAFALHEVARAYAMLADPSAVPASDPTLRPRRQPDDRSATRCWPTRRWSAAIATGSTPR